jgi:ion channel-forming bestrophin family protein
MIRYDPKSWVKLIFSMHQSQLMRYLLPTMVGIGLMTALMVFLFDLFWKGDYPDTLNLHTIVGLVLGLVLVFRTNTAYDRWWEGRRLFGTLTNTSRNLALKLHGTLPLHDRENRLFFARSIANYYLAVKEHLRKGVILEELDLTSMPYAASLPAAQHKPAHIAGAMQQRLNQLLTEKEISGDHYLAMVRDLDSFVDVVGACERIRNTPIPYSYSSYIKKVIFFYLLTFPLSMIHTMGYMSVPMIMFATYVIAGIEVLAEEIEDPFGNDVNDLDSDSMAHNIKSNVREILQVSHIAVEGEKLTVDV